MFLYSLDDGWDVNFERDFNGNGFSFDYKLFWIDLSTFCDSGYSDLNDTLFLINDESSSSGSFNRFNL